MSTFHHAWIICRKDLRIYFRDRASLLLGFLLPIVLVTVFGLIMGAASGNGGSMPKIELWVADQASTSQSAELIDSLRRSEMLLVRPRPGETVEMNRLLAKVADGDASHVLVIPPDYSPDADAPDSESLRMIRDPGRKIEDQVIQMALMQSMVSVSGGDYWKRTLSRSLSDAGMSAGRLTEINVQADRMTDLIGDWVALQEEGSGGAEEAQPASGDRTLVGGWMGVGPTDLQIDDVLPPDRPKQVTYQMAQSVSGMAVMMLMFGLVACGSSLLRERDAGTLRRLMTSALPHNSIVVGKMMFTASVGLIQMMVMLVYGELLFGIGTFRDPVTLLVVAVFWTAVATGIGMLIASVAQTAKQADSLSPILVLSLAALGGCWFPLQMLDLPTAVEWATRATPTFWAMTGFQRYFWNGADLTDARLLTALGIQFAFAVGLLVIATALFRRNYLRG